MKKEKFQPKFLVDGQGKIIAIQLDIKVYKALIEELADYYDIKNAEQIIAKKNKTYTIDELERSILDKGK